MTDEIAFTIATLFGICAGGLWAFQISDYDPEVKPEYIAQIAVAWIVGFAVSISALKIIFQ